MCFLQFVLVASRLGEQEGVDFPGGMKETEGIPSHRKDRASKSEGGLQEREERRERDREREKERDSMINLSISRI